MIRRDCFLPIKDCSMLLKCWLNIFKSLKYFGNITLICKNICDWGVGIRYKSVDLGIKSHRMTMQIELQHVLCWYVVVICHFKKHVFNFKISLCYSCCVFSNFWLLLFCLFSLFSGEVFVLNDGGEVDLDLGNYERFLDISLYKDNNITTGKIYQHVINKERHGDYLGKTVQGDIFNCVGY